MNATGYPNDGYDGSAASFERLLRQPAYAGHCRNQRPHGPHGFNCPGTPRPLPCTNPLPHGPHDGPGNPVGCPGMPAPRPAAPAGLPGRSVTVEIRNVYGNDLTYPADDESRLLARLAGTKTFTRAHLAVLRELGYEITETCEHETRGRVNHGAAGDWLRGPGGGR